jgi:hypothetical protein
MDSAKRNGSSALQHHVVSNTVESDSDTYPKCQWLPVAVQFKKSQRRADLPEHGLVNSFGWTLPSSRFK